MIPDAHALADRLGGVTIADRHRLGRRLERARRRPGEDAPAELGRLASDLERAEAHRARRAAAVPAVDYPPELPVSAHRDDLRAAIAAHQVVVVAGETGSGKTTQLPKLCLELGRGVDGMIGHTQPRRIAARTVAERLADELAVPLGGPVGYAVRFSDTVGRETLVKVMTDGILLAEIRRDRQLRAYDTIIVDEAHERSLNIDFLLGYLAQLLPQRPDLKVIVTSATIDTARFAAHFGAPVVEVSGRTYPVEVRYRPVRADDAAERDRDPLQALCDAVGELAAEGPGDVLVFLPGERDIRDAADALRSAGPERAEVLPLYARLSAAEQHRVFRPHRGRRIVLATNVAETSLTVPGIRFVVDTGLARISRYSLRTKVQRLPIEAISRASADQRAGRCGRVAPGICIRLYAEEDYDARPAFTDPEILRTNLASVILQMASIGLGEVASFPFVEPPDRRAVADGRALLEELGAIERRDRRLRLTAIGRRLAELPLDPRLGRMVLEAAERGCLREVTVIAAALSIQDPRERPVEAAQEADALHARFVVPDSDFLGHLRLYEHVAELQSSLSGNQFRRRLRAEYLSVLRVREWQDVAGQIRQALRAAGVHANHEPAAADEIHQALLAGLLSHVGMRDRRRGDYEGARATRWQIGRSSALARRQPPWVMAGALVETGRTFATTVARIDPSWLERVGAHVVRRRHGDPHWDARRAEAMTDERVSLYGLPVVAGRPVSLAGVDPALARAMLVDHGLIEGDWQLSLPPLERTRARIGEIVALEERMRRHGLYAGDEALAAAYDRVLPGDITTGSRLERWWRRERTGDASALELALDVLVEPGAGPLDPSAYPDVWRQGDLELPLRYRWSPGAADDGVTAEVPLVALGRIDETLLDWHVPGYRNEVVAAVVRALPKELRRALVPVAEVAEKVASGGGPADGPLTEVVAERLSAIAGVPVDPASVALDRIPGYLRIRYEVVGPDGDVLADGRDFDELRALLAPLLRATVARSVPELELHGATTWSFGDLPREVRRGALVAYPALVDEGTAVGVVPLEAPGAQAASMWSGTRRLLLLAAPEATRLRRRLGREATLALARARSSLPDLLADAAVAAADAILAAHGGPSFERAGFEEMASQARRELPGRVGALVTAAADILVTAGEVAAELAALRAEDRTGALEAALADARRQLARLVRPGFIAVAGEEHLGDVPRYLEALRRRLARLPGDLRRDAARQAVLERLERRHDQLEAQLAPRRVATSGGARGPWVPGALPEVRWMLEELRVSLWAQALGTRTPVSEERIRRALAKVASSLQDAPSAPAGPVSGPPRVQQ